jgi:hypothetical protein
VKRLIIWVVMCVAVAGLAGAATYYVDEVNGADDPGRSGGPGDPWRTITYALSRTSGENTFMCRGTFEEEVTVAWEDRKSAFVANPDATLDGWIRGEHEVTVDLTGFDVYGYVAGGPLGAVAVTDSYFNNPSGSALGINHYYGCAQAESSLFENCASVCGVGNWEFGRIGFYDCEVKDCGRGVSVFGEGSASFTNCEFTNIAETAFGGNFYGEGATFTGCEFYDCAAAIELDGSITHGYWVGIRNCVFRRNGWAISVIKEGDWGDGDIVNNVLTANVGMAMSVGGYNIKLRGNVVKDNDDYGVCITGGDPDLGTPGDPGGNTFAGNKSGYDVYNASPEDIAAVGNTWDPQAEAEMKGKTWQEVNVTRIYDHWDDPNVGYVMWSEPILGVAPASLGRIKASFREGAAPAVSPPGSAAVDR